MSAREALQLAQKLAEMGAEDGNIDSYMRQGVYNDYLKAHGEPEFGTSDFIASVPMVYMITNGVELIIKGYLYAAHPDEAPSAPPKLPEMIQRFKAEFPDNDPILAFINSYTEDDLLPELFARFLAENGVKLAELYKERRFLNNASFYSITDRYQGMIYSWEDGKAFYQRVLEQVNSVLPIIDELQADIDSDGVPGERAAALRK
jgi:hypothetical protein